MTGEDEGNKDPAPPEPAAPRVPPDDGTAGPPAVPPPDALDGLAPEARAAVIDLFAALTRRAAGHPEGAAEAEDDDHEQ